MQKFISDNNKDRMLMGYWTRVWLFYLVWVLGNWLLLALHVLVLGMHSYNTASPNWYILFSNTVQLYLDKPLCDFVMGSWETINPSLYHNSTWYTVLFHCKLCTNTVHQVGSFLFSCPSRAVVTVIIMIVRVIIHKVAIIEIIMEYAKVVKYTSSNHEMNSQS